MTKVLVFFVTTLANVPSTSQFKEAWRAAMSMSFQSKESEERAAHTSSVFTDAGFPP